MLQKILKKSINSVDNKKRILQFISDVLSYIGLIGIFIIFGMVCYEIHKLALICYICALLVFIGYILDQGV